MHILVGNWIIPHIDVFWGHWKYMGSDICHLIGLDAHNPKCNVKNSEASRVKVIDILYLDY